LRMQPVVMGRAAQHIEACCVYPLISEPHETCVSE
jgi:hypothetical protein